MQALYHVPVILRTNDFRVAKSNVAEVAKTSGVVSNTARTLNEFCYEVLHGSPSGAAAFPGHFRLKCDNFGRDCLHHRRRLSRFLRPTMSIYLHPDLILVDLMMRASRQNLFLAPSCDVPECLALDE